LDINCFILDFDHLLIYWSYNDVYGVFKWWEWVQVDLKLGFCPRMHGLDQTSITLEVCVYVTRKWALLDTTMKWNSVWCFYIMLGWTKVCLHAFKEWFTLRIGVKSKGTSSKSEDGIFKKTGQFLGWNWKWSTQPKIIFFVVDRSVC